MAKIIEFPRQDDASIIELHLKVLKEDEMIMTVLYMDSPTYVPLSYPGIAIERCKDGEYVNLAIHQDIAMKFGFAPF